MIDENEAPEGYRAVEVIEQQGCRGCALGTNVECKVSCDCRAEYRDDCEDVIFIKREGQQMTDELHSALTHIRLSIPEECRHSLEVIERALKSR